MSKIKWILEKRKIKDLTPHPKNPRLFTKKGMKDLEKSIKNIGMAQPVNITKDGIILSGHARIMKLKEMGENEVDVYVPNVDLSEKQQDEIIVRMNANTAGQWDFDILANEFEDFELEEWGMEIPAVENFEIEKEDKDLSDSLKSKYILEIECDSEAEQEILYNRFLGERLKVKILSI